MILPIDNARGFRDTGDGVAQRRQLSRVSCVGIMSVLLYVAAQRKCSAACTCTFYNYWTYVKGTSKMGWRHANRKMLFSLFLSEFY